MSCEVFRPAPRRVFVVEAIYATLYLTIGLLLNLLTPRLLWLGLYAVLGVAWFLGRRIQADAIRIEIDDRRVTGPARWGGRQTLQLSEIDRMRTVRTEFTKWLTGVHYVRSSKDDYIRIEFLKFDRESYDAIRRKLGLSPGLRT